MAKKYYCSSCGIELTYSRKAVKGKGIILDLIAPHECEGFSIASNPDGKPTAEEIINDAKPLGAMKKVSDADSKVRDKGMRSVFEGNYGDKRDGVKSTAPAGLLNSMNNITGSGVDTVEG